MLAVARVIYYSLPTQDTAESFTLFYYYLLPFLLLHSISLSSYGDYVQNDSMMILIRLSLVFSFPLWPMVIFSLIIFARCQCVSSIQKFMFRLCTHWPNIYDPCIGISNQKNQHKYNKSNENLLPAMRIKSRPMYTLFFWWYGLCLSSSFMYSVIQIHLLLSEIATSSIYYWYLYSLAMQLQNAQARSQRGDNGRKFNVKQVQ